MDDPQHRAAHKERSRNRQRSNQPGQRGAHPRAKPSGPLDIWHAPPPVPDVEPIVIPAEVDALLRSLGEAPAIGGSAVAEHYFAAVVQRTAAVARALALSADVLAEPDA